MTAVVRRYAESITVIVASLAVVAVWCAVIPPGSLHEVGVRFTYAFIGACVPAVVWYFLARRK